MGVAMGSKVELAWFASNSVSAGVLAYYYAHMHAHCNTVQYMPGVGATHFIWSTLSLCLANVRDKL